jgi:hypothetical protein
MKERAGVRFSPWRTWRTNENANIRSKTQAPRDEFGNGTRNGLGDAALCGLRVESARCGADSGGWSIAFGHRCSGSMRSVTADVEAKSLVADGAGDATDVLRILFDDHHRPSGRRKLVRRGQPRRTRPDLRSCEPRRQLSILLMRNPPLLCSAPSSLEGLA